MAQDDIPGVRGAPGGPGRRQGAPGGARGHQGAPGGARLLLRPKNSKIMTPKYPNGNKW